MSHTQTAPDLKWLDAHVHIDGDTPSLEKELMDVLDATGADVRFVISPGNHCFTAMRERGEATLESARMIQRLVQQAPGRLYGSCCVNTHHLDDALRTMDLCFGELGFLMLGEMLGYIFHFDMDTPSGHRVVRKAVEYDVPVQIHLSTSNNPQQGHTSGMGQLEDILGLAEHVPEARYILAHMVGMLEDDPPVVCAYLDEIERRCGGWPDNFWAEIIDFHSPGVAVALERIPRQRLIVGTDWTTRVGRPCRPYGVDHLVWSGAECAYEPSVHKLVEFLRGWGASDEDVRAIGFANAAALLGVDS